MTRANIEQQKHTPWFAKAGAACSIVPLSRFVGPNVFALKGGGYGCLFSLTGLDEEGLTDQELESRVRQIEGALRGLPEGSCLYQYTRVMSGFELPRQKHYANEVTETFTSDRLGFLDNNASFRRIDLHWCLTLEPYRAKAFQRRPEENAVDTSRMLSDLEKTATLLEGHLGSALGLKLLGKNEVFQFFSYLFNLEEWAGRGKLRSDIGVDRQIVQTPVAWHSDHVQVGQRHVQMFSLKTTPEASRPCLFAGLLSLDCDSVLCTTWRVKSASAARSEIDQQEKFISFFKVGVLTRVMSGRDTASLETGAGAKAANNSVDDLSDVIRSLDKKAQGEFSLRLLVAAGSPQQLRDTTPSVHRIFVDCRAQVMEETLGNLSAFYAMFPGNHKFNVFPMWLAEDHHARLSSVFAPHIGHQHSEDLDSEYLNIFETRTRTPFFQDAYVDGVRVMLIIGPTGTGKTIVALHRAAHLARKHRDARVLLTTFSVPLANALRAKLRLLLTNEPRLGERMEVYAMDAIGRRLYELNIGKLKIATESEISELLREASRSAGEHKFSLRFLTTEWDQVVDSWQLDSWEEYRDVNRLGRKTRLREEQRKLLWTIFEAVRAGLREQGLITTAGMFNVLARHYATGAPAPFEFTVVDEAQDISIAQVRFLASMAGERANGLFFSGDLGQRIFQQPFSWKAAGVDVRGRSITLKINYRTSHQIRSQADRLLDPQIADVDGNVESRRGALSLFNGPAPTIRAYSTAEEESEGVAKWLRQLASQRFQPQEMALIVRSGAQIDRAKRAAELAGIYYHVLDEHVELAPGTLSISTMHLAKGLEFRAVGVMACDDEVLPLQRRMEAVVDESDLQDVYSTERHLLYVACTRARDHLSVTCLTPGSEFLQDINWRTE